MWKQESGYIKFMDESGPEPEKQGEDANDADAKFKWYLLREFYWEMEQRRPIPVMFRGVERDSVEVLSYQGYDDLRVKVSGVEYDIHLSWKQAIAPVIKQV